MTADAFADGPEPEDDETAQPREHARLGEYRLVQRLGEGGMGVVHLALDRHGRAVAIKVLRQHIAHDPDARARLTREVRSLRRIRAPGSPRSSTPTSTAPPPTSSRATCPGQSLDDHVAERGLLAPADLHRVGVRAGRGPRRHPLRRRRAPRRQARQRAARRRRPGAHRLRHRPRGRRHPAHDDRPGHGDAGLPRARGGRRG